MGCCPSKSVLLDDNSCFYYDWAIAQASNSLIEVHIPEFVHQRNNGQSNEDMVQEIFSEINEASIDKDLDESKDEDVKIKIEDSSEKSSEDFEELDDNCETNEKCNANEATIAEVEVHQLEKRENEIPENDEELKYEVAEVKTDNEQTQCLNSQLSGAVAQTLCDLEVQDISKASEEDSSKANNEPLRKPSRKDSFMNKILTYYFRPKTGK